MNAERLLELYEQISEAPDAVARLRRFVLDLAVRGKLGTQDSGDEPATNLLGRIASERARIIRDGKFKSFDGVLSREESSFAFPLPANWQWCYLDDLAAIARGGSPRPIKSFLTNDPDGIPWIKIGDSTRGSIYINNTAERIKPQGLSKSRLVVPGDLLLSNSMSFGFPYVTNIEGCIHDGWLVIRTPEEFISKLFLHKVFLSDHAKRSFSNAASGAVVQNLNADKVRQLSVPLPPLAEQHRIVAKVDELMALCDRLEEARKTREETRDKLTAASLARLTAPDTDPQDFPTHARFALETLPDLTTRPVQIKTLRQTILNLAVRGKLVEQDPGDEPAPELVERIAEERQELLAAGEIPRKHEPNRDPERGTAVLPSTWQWIALGQICNLVTSGSRGWGDYYSDVGPAFVRAQNIRFGRLELDQLACVSPPKNSEGSRTQIKVHDLLVVITGAGVTTPALLEQDIGEAYVSQHVGLVRLTDARLSPWILLCLMSEEGGRGELVDRAYGAGRPGLNLENIRTLSIPIPPLAEQHRIVAKVDALMALCDRLEAALITADTTRTRLLDALLHEALEPATEALEAAE